jgi:hypothetical protein
MTPGTLVLESLILDPPDGDVTAVTGNVEG